MSGSRRLQQPAGRTDELLLPFLTGRCSCHVLAAGSARLDSCSCPVRSGEQGEEKMPPPPPIRLDPPHPYLKTHVCKVARLHLYDWVVLALLVAIDVGLNLIEPFHRFVGEDMMADLRYPLKSNTVPVWAVPIYAVIGPIIIVVGIYMKRRNVYDIHHAILGKFFLQWGLLFSVLITGVLTDAIKDGVGRPRPNFFWRCFPDGVPKYNNITTQVICHGDPAVIKEGHKSFPSGHSSWSFAGLGFLSWYLTGKIKAFDRRGHVAKLCIVLLPLLLATMVAISRVDDYWHHWQDVFAGGILGLVVASFCYLQFFPPPSGEQAPPISSGSDCPPPPPTLTNHAAAGFSSPPPPATADRFCPTRLAVRLALRQLNRRRRPPPLL
ncbi:lipid phosphate phosphatase 2 [Panicum miliaceum]|uniref:Lipid phosphate phosphatase 2 n=1 Tax=Panicum miliaceum TaxID=4540 RepID=A0A3L6SXS8_PANMI|nr:lipid phosphate phosphatase 2 [Panicum miliaceum]